MRHPRNGTSALSIRSGLYWLTICGVALVFLIGCGSDAPTVTIDLRTDFVPATEFDTAAVFVDGASFASTNHIVQLGSDYVRGVRLASEQPGTGTHHFRVALFQAGVEFASRTVTAEIQGDHAITVVLSRDCRDVMCPGAGDAASQTACLGGLCIDPRCTPETPEFCEAAECTAPSDCPPHACADVRCAGACLYAPNDDTCGDGLRCDVEAGCVPDVTDAGPADAATDTLPDVGVDSGTDAGVDASADAGTDSGVDAGTDSGPPFDAGMDAGYMMCPERWPDPPGSCDPRSREPCGPSGGCHPNAGTTGCFLATGASAEGEACGAGDCAPGYTCISAIGTLDMRCRAFCAHPHHCTCDNEDEICWPTSGSAYGACIPGGCNPVTDEGCPAAESCVFTLFGSTCMNTPRTGALGDACVSSADCQRGHHCITWEGRPQCLRTCDAFEDPASCSCIVLGDSTRWGHCPR